MKKLLATAAGIITIWCIGVTSYLLVQNSNKAREIVHLESQINRTKPTLRFLISQLDTLQKPSDPLSSYNEVCNQDMTNSYSGATQTYYFPCTNQAQTTPQPGY